MERMRRALQSALSSPTPDREGSGGAASVPTSPQAQPPPAARADPSVSRHSDNEEYTERLRRVQASVASVRAALRLVGETCSALSEDVASFARESSSDLAVPASELLNSCQILSSTCVKLSVDALDARVERPLATLLAAHAELEQRAASRDRAAAEYAAAVAELKVLGERQRQSSTSLSSVRSRLAGAPRPGGADEEQPSGGGGGASRAAEQQARVVQRAAAANALTSALTVGLEEELASLLDRRLDVATSLVRDCGDVLQSFFLGCASSFNTSGRRAGEPGLEQLDASVGRLRDIVKSSAESVAWGDVGQARRDALRQESAMRKLTSRQLRSQHAVRRPVPLHAYLHPASGGGGGSEQAERLLERPPGSLAPTIVLSCVPYAALLAGFLTPADATALLTASGGMAAAVHAEPAAFWWQLVRHRSAGLLLAPRASARWRLQFWDTALGTGPLPGAYWSVGRGQVVPSWDGGQFQALLALARAEAAAGSKDSVSPGSLDDEPFSATWLTLIEQDVARSYAAGVSVGTSIQVQRARHRMRGRMFEQGGGEEVGTARGRHVSRRSSLPAGPVTPVVLLADGSSGAGAGGDGHAAQHTMSLDCFLTGGGGGGATPRARPLAVGRPRAGSAAALLSSPARDVPTRAVDAPPARPSLLKDKLSEREADAAQHALLQVLLAVAASEPAVRYMQGMNGVGRLILEVTKDAGVEEEDAPRRAAGLFLGLLRSGGGGGDGSDGAVCLPPPTHSQLRSLFLPDTACLRLRLYQLERLLLRRLPQVHARLAEHGIAVDAFAPSWLLPLFANFTVLDPPSALRVWDAYLLHGWPALLSVCLGVLEELACELVEASMEDCLAILSAPRVHIQAGAGGGRSMVPSQERAALASLVDRSLGEALVDSTELGELEKDFAYVPRLV